MGSFPKNGPQMCRSHLHNWYKIDANGFVNLRSKINVTPTAFWNRSCCGSTTASTVKASTRSEATASIINHTGTQPQADNPSISRLYNLPSCMTFTARLLEAATVRSTRDRMPQCTDGEQDRQQRAANNGAWSTMTVVQRRER